MNKTYELLEWDADFFGFAVARINDPLISGDALTGILDELSGQGVKLIYLSRSEPLTDTVHLATHYDIRKVDIKTTYMKALTLTGAGISAGKVSAYTRDYPEDKLMKLAVDSGVYSRFNVDKAIPEGKYEELYRLWMVNSVNKKIAEEVLVYTDGDQIAGFVTLGEKNGRADIGIIAVDEAFRGRGIGKTLMLCAENWFLDKGYGTIQVVTQGDNIPACKLYEGCGYSVDKVEYFYHMWLKS